MHGAWVRAFSDGVSIGGSSQWGTLHFVPYAAAGSESVLERTNVTGNSATAFGAAVAFDWCIFFWTVQTSASIRCISVRSNTADDRYAGYQGLSHVTKKVTISESAIAGNAAPFLVHGDSASILITFSECHFDSFSQTATVAGFLTVNCCCRRRGRISGSSGSLSEPQPHAAPLGEPECSAPSVASASAHCGPAILFPNFVFSMAFRLSRKPGRFRSLFSAELVLAISICQFSWFSLGRFFGLSASAKIGGIGGFAVRGSRLHGKETNCWTDCGDRRRCRDDCGGSWVGGLDSPPTGARFISHFTRSYETNQ
jgi:hypothetical protein